MLPKSGRYASDNLTEATAPHGVQFHVRLPPKEPSPMFVRWLLNGIVILISIAALWVILVPRMSSGPHHWLSTPFGEFDTTEQTDRAITLAALAIMIFAVTWTIGRAATSLTNRSRTYQKRTNHCLMCNYNLRGNTSGVCPECGAKITNT